MLYVSNRIGPPKMSPSIQKKQSFAKRVVIICTFVMLCPTFAWSVELKSLPDSFLEQTPTIALENALMEKAQNQGGVRVIVRFAQAITWDKNLPSTQDLEAQQQSVARGQDEVLDWLTNAKVKHIKRFKYTPGMAMELDADALAILKANGQYTIQEDVPVPPALAESVPVIHADDVWSAGVDGSDQTIAILDTGVDKTHEFLDGGKVVSEACYSSNSVANNSSTVCPNGLEEQEGVGAGVNCTLGVCDHGTHVAGIAAGNGAADGFDGVARGANIIAIQVFSRFNGSATNPNSSCSTNGLSSPCVLTYISDQARGLERVYELRNSYKIAAVNMSLGGGNFSSACNTDSRKSDVDNLRSVQIATVISSGNNGFSNGIGAPACISSAVSVGNTTKNDTVRFSSNSAAILDLLAPGTSIQSSVPSSSSDAYEFKTGTSMAAPHVAGAFALLKDANNTATVDELLNALKDTGVDVTDTKNNLTKPRVDLKAAYDRVIKAPRLSSPRNGCTKTSRKYYLCYSNYLFKTQITFTGHPAAIGESQAPLSHYLWIGSSKGGSNHFSGWMSNRSVTVSGLPSLGTIYVRYWTKFSSGWKSVDHTFRMQAFSIAWDPQKEWVSKWKLDTDDVLIPIIKDEKLKWVPDFCDPRFCDPSPLKQREGNLIQGSPVFKSIQQK